MDSKAFANSVAVILGPRDASFWIFVGVFVPAVLSIVFDVYPIVSGCSLMVGSAAFIMVGCTWAASILGQQGVSGFRKLAYLFPLIGLVVIMFTDWQNYKRPFYCQLRGIILVSVVLLVPLVAPNRFDPDRPHQTLPRPKQHGVGPSLDRVFVVG